MSDVKDQAPDSPSQESTLLPFKKRDIAEITLPGSSGAAETMSSGSDYDYLLALNKKLKLDELQKKAYFHVLHAFAAESSAISSPRITIIDKLKREWNIAYKTHTAFEDKIKADPLVQQSRKKSLASDEKEKQKVSAAEEGKITAVEGNPMNKDDVSEKEKAAATCAPTLGSPPLASDEKEKQKVAAAEEGKITAVEGNPLKLRLKLNKDDLVTFQERLNVAPAKMQEDKAEPSSTSEVSAIPSWGQVSPASLVNKWISIRIPGEDDYVAYLIGKYDAETEMHHLVTAISDDDLVDPCNWIDLRNFPAEDIVWQEGHPGFPTHKRCLKLGETILHSTSTAREKRRIMEVGKTASGIPIIKKFDKGKGIA